VKGGKSGEVSNNRDFYTDEQRTRQANIRLAFDSFYKDHFDVKRIRQASQYMDRKRGVDIIIELNNGRNINSQEKIVCAWYTKYPGSFYVEIKMVYENGREKQGWLYDECDADILCICYEKYKPGDQPKCFGLKMDEFKNVAIANVDRWYDLYRLLKTPTTANNTEWVTHCLLVPYDEIRLLIDDARIEF
jgi:hypothetical protein